MDAFLDWASRARDTLAFWYLRRSSTKSKAFSIEASTSFAFTTAFAGSSLAPEGAFVGCFDVTDPVADHVLESWDTCASAAGAERSAVESTRGTKYFFICLLSCEKKIIYIIVVIFRRVNIFDISSSTSSRNSITRLFISSIIFLSLWILFTFIEMCANSSVKRGS